MNRKSTHIVALLVVLIAATSIGWSQRGVPRFSDWSPVVHLPAPVNSEFSDQAPVLSRDEKKLYFTSDREPGGFGGEDIWISTRKTRNSPWGAPVNLGPTVNTSAMERLRSVTTDGRILLFQSDREGGLGQTDIWAAVRRHVNDDFDWSEPVNLGSNINSAFTELASNFVFADAGLYRKLFFASSKPGGFGGADIYESTVSDSGFETSINVFELNTPSIETCFWVRDDGLEIIFSSNRPDVTGDRTKDDLWVSTRNAVYEPWGTAVNLGPSVNVTGSQDVNPSLSSDGRTMFIASRRPGGIGAGTFDIYMTTRRRVSP